jgi:hypothetical protein
MDSWEMRVENRWLVLPTPRRMGDMMGLSRSEMMESSIAAADMRRLIMSLE